MAYTIPEYVDTPEQAILAVASAVKDEQVTGGDGSVNTALDILADTLAQQDVQVPQTNAGAILALAQYVSGGGGDFTTASVVFALDGYTGDAFSLPVPVILDGYGLVPAIPSERIDGETAWNAVLYQGSSSIQAPVGTLFSASTGNITVDEDGYLAAIAGNGTITISGDD